MIRTVYADLLFLINFSMDFLCFFLVSRLLCRKMPMGRTVLASALGAVYAVISLFLPFRGLLLLLCDGFVCVLMCILKEAKRGASASGILRESLIYTGVSMALGGVMTATYSALGELGLSELSKGEGDGISAWLFLLLAVIGGGATFLGSGFFRGKSKECFYDVTVSLCGSEVTYRALVDTGNALCDPISGCPAAVLDRRAALPLFRGVDPALLERPTECVASLSTPLCSRVRLLPVATATGEGLLLAFRPDKCIVVRTEGGEPEEYAILIALAPIAAEDAVMLLPPNLPAA